MQFDIRDYVKSYNCLEEKFCDQVVENIKHDNWRQHQFYNFGNETYHSYDKELSICYSNIQEKEKIKESVHEVLYQYLAIDLKFSWYTRPKFFTEIRFNKYDKSTQMELHCDHIHSMFDGNLKGVPIISIVGLLNDNFEGGDLVFFGDQKYPLKKGDIVVFPSNFLFPHHVVEVTNGTRYSFVSWAV